MSGFVFRLQVLLAFGVVAALLMLTGSGFLVAALYLNLATYAGPTGAAAITGVLCLAVGGIVLLIGWLVLRSAARRDGRDRKPTDAAGLALALGEALGGDLQSLAKNHRYAMIGAALAAGFAVGVSPKLRRALRSLLDT
jgi:energy-converting hydrogenase Eha subunit C